ncbi:AAA family ATPase [bacterium]|nr:AAA family ATPase [bacterium]
MICPKCGAELSDNANRCSICGIKVNIRCPECNTVNPFGTKFCKNCGFDFLIQCPVCGSTNIYLSKECRKCHSLLDSANKSPKDTKSKIKINNEVEVVNAFSAEQSSYSSKNIIEHEPVQKKQPEIQIKPDDEGMPFVEDAVSNDNALEEQIFNIPDSASAKSNNIVEKTEENSILSETNTIEAIDNSADNIVDENSNPYIGIEQVEPQNNILMPQITDDEPSIDDIFESQEDISITEIDEPVNIQTDDIVEKENIQEQELDVVEDLQNEEEYEEYAAPIQQEAVEKAVNLINNSLKKHIIAINGPEGSGKSAILNQVSKELFDKGFVPLFGSCTPLVQITSFGFFQDAFLRMMKFPPYTNNVDSFYKEFKKSEFSRQFSFLNQTELGLFLNMFYPSQRDEFANILENKNKMFAVLEKAIKSFLTNNNLVIIIDNFELLDGASYDFLMHILNKGFFNNRLKLLVAYQENKSIQSYFDITGQNEEIFETILIKKLTKDEMISTINHSLKLNIEDVLDSDYLDRLILKSEGNALRLEQEIAMLIDIGYIAVENNKILINPDCEPEISPTSLEDLIKLRLNTITPAVKNILFMSAIMGYRFAPKVLYRSMGVDLSAAIEYLIQEMYIVRVDEHTCEFKNLTLWKLVYQEAKNDLLYKENSEKIYQTLKQLILSSNLQKLISCTEALSSGESFLIWQNTASLSAKLGDTNLYVIAQKQCLKILEEQENEDADEIKAEIYEEIGKLLCEKSPKESVTYLANVLDAEIKDSNIRKIIDISGYFVKSCYLSGNYYGVTEAVDAILKQIEDSSNITPTDIALIKTRKLRALLYIGNSEQIIELANEEIIPVLERNIENQKNDLQYKNLIINAWLLTKIVLAKAYGIQGNRKISEVVAEIRSFLDKYKNNADYYHVQTGIIDAFSKTITGDINNSNDILNHISLEYKERKMETNLLAEWNLINIINRVLLGQSNNLKIDLFELAAFTNNINEHFIKNIVKLILGNVLDDEGNTTKALEIFNEEITYFAKEKIAIGALLSWAMIVKVSMKSEEEDKAFKIATQALGIAKKHEINNYFFIIYFKRVLAQIYMHNGDLEAAKMYLEESVVIAKQYGLKYQLVELYIEYATYTEELMKAKRIYSSENIKTAFDLYNKAVVAAKELKIPRLSDRAYKARAGFKTFCQLNSIEL